MNSSKCNKCGYIGKSSEFGKGLEGVRHLMKTEEMFTKNVNEIMEGLKEKCPKCGYTGILNDGYSDVTTKAKTKKQLVFLGEKGK